MTRKRIALMLALTAGVLWTGTGAEARLGRQAGRANPLATQRWQVGRGHPRATIVFLHGLDCNPDGQVIKRLVKAFDRRGDSYKVVAPWLRPVRPGHNGEIASAGVHTMSDQLRRARRLLQDEQGPVVLMGHSFGGKAALQLAREFPNKVSCVVGFAPSINMLHSYWKRLSGERGLPNDPRILKQQLQQHQVRLANQLTQARRSGDRKEIRVAKEQLSYHTTMQDLIQFQEPRVETGIRTPTLVFHGSNDRAVSIHYARRFAEHDRNPGVTLKELPGTDHHFLKYKRSLLGGVPTVDQRATDRMTRELATEVSSFIAKHVRGN